MLNDPDRRIRADAASLNLDTSDGTLRRFGQRHGGKNNEAPGCRPMDLEPLVLTELPLQAVPDVADVRREIVPGSVPEIPPAVAVLLDEFLAEPPDPWDLAASP